MNRNIFIRIREHSVVTAILLIGVALMTTACSPKLAQYKIQPTQKVDIQVPLPDQLSTSAELNLEFWAGEINLAPGANGHLASGTATFNAADFTPKIEATGASYKVRQGDLKIEGITKCPEDVKNTWDLQLANMPMRLNIKAGAYAGSFELGGLSLEKLSISEAGSNLKGSFSKPNQVKMSSLTYSTGGSNTELRGLANANFEQMTLTSKAGNYLLSFDGDLQRDASVMIDAGMGAVTMIVPAGVNAVLTFDGSLTGVNPSGEWVKNDNVYTHSGSGPTLTITVKIKAGTLNLKDA